MNQDAMSPPTPADPDAWAARFVWIAWVSSLLLALAYVGKYGSHLPYRDDRAWLPVMSGVRPLTLGWLWEQQNEHRVPLPKLAYYLLGRLGGCDFRAGMVVNVALLGALSFGLLRAIRAARGRLQYPDAFVPLVVLSLGQAECLLWTSALNLVAGTAAAGLFLILLAGAGRRISPRRAVLMAACLVPMPLLGAGGLVFVPALSPWVAAVAALHCRAADAPARRRGMAALGLVGAAVLLCGLYFVGYHGVPGPAPARSKPAAALSCGLQMLSLFFGPGENRTWRWKAYLVLGLLAASGRLWADAWRRRPGERGVLLGHLAFLLAAVGLVVAVAWGRADYGVGAGFAGRYVTLMLPMSCGLYVFWGRYAGGAGVRTVLLLLAVAFLGANYHEGVRHGRTVREEMTHFRADPDPAVAAADR